MAVLEHFYPAKQIHYMHWYRRLPPRFPKPNRNRRRYSSSVINNVWNAWSNWENAVEHNPAGILQTMKVQINNLAQVISASFLSGDERSLVVQLISEVQQALNSLNPALLNQQVQRTSSRTTMQRHASDRSEISSNAKAALGVLRYLADDTLFPGCADLFIFVQERMQQIFGIMDGDMSAQDVVAVRQQQSQQAAQQYQQGAQVPSQAASGAVTPPDTSSTPISTAPAISMTGSMPQAQNAAQSPSAGSGSQVSSNSQINPGLANAGQSVSISPVAGLQPQPVSWDGTPNTTSKGEETVGSHQDWYSTYGTTPSQFIARCSRWLRETGAGRAALVIHLRASGVPDNVIAQTIPYV